MGEGALHLLLLQACVNPLCGPMGVHQASTEICPEISGQSRWPSVQQLPEAGTLAGIGFIGWMGRGPQGVERGQGLEHRPLGCIDLGRAGARVCAGGWGHAASRRRGALHGTSGATAPLESLRLFSLKSEKPVTSRRRRGLSTARPLPPRLGVC